MITDVKIKPGCISCKTCEHICPKIFKINGTSEVISNEYEKYSNSIIEAAQNCPVQVISITNTDSSSTYTEKNSLSLELIKKTLLANSTYEFVFSAPKISNFHPGQFATVTLKDQIGSFARCYSIKSWSNGKIAFCIKLLPDGRGSQVLANMQVNEKIKLRAGMGTFLLKNTNLPKLFIATGTGLAPIMAMLEAIPQEIPKKLIFGVRHEEDLFYLDELKKFQNLDVEIWLSQPGKNWEGNAGKVTEALTSKIIPKKEKIEVYICGNPLMVQSAIDILQSKDHSNIDLSYELFTSSSISNNEKTKAKNITLALIPLIKRTLLVASALTPLQYFFPESIPFLWDLSLYAVIILMLIRPLRDLFPKINLFSRLIVLRKELGIFSASVVAASAAIHYLNPDFSFLTTYFSLEHWSLTDNKLWAHLGELTGVILLLTSNIFSQRMLRTNWKRIQRLSYIYCFAGAYYVWASFDKTVGLWGLIAVFIATFFAFIKNNLLKQNA